MPSINDITARLVLDAKNFTAGFQSAVDQAATKARAGGTQISRAFSDTAGEGLRNFAGQVPVVGGALTGLSGLALTAAAGIGAFTAAAGFAIANTEEYAQAARQLDAVLKATGNQTGFTSAQLKEFAEAQESALATSAESILKAEQVLASFDGVAGTTFKRATIAAADLAAVYGGDLSGNAEKLGVVLQNLAQGNVEGLSRGFKFLGQTTLDTIAALAKTGDTAAAQTALLDALEQKVGGAGGAAGQGVAGAFFRLKDALGDASRAFAEQSGLYAATVDGLNAAADAASAYVDKLNELNGFQLTGEIFKKTSPLYLLYDKLFGSGQVAGINLAAGNSPGFSGFGAGGGGSKAAEDASAKAAADRAKAEGDRARATAAAATAATKHATESERAAKAIAAQQKSLNASIADLEFQAKTAGLSRAEAEKLTTIRRLELQYGKLLSENDRQRIANAIELRQQTEESLRQIDDFVSSTKGAVDGFFGTLGSRTANPATSGAGGGGGATEAGQQFRYIADSFYDAFSGRSGDIWGNFKDLGVRTLSELAAQFATSGSFNFGGTSLGSLFGGGGGGAAGGGAGFGSFAAAAGPLALSSLIATGLASIAGTDTGIAGSLGFLPSVLAGIGPTPRGFANLTTNAGGAQISGQIKRGSGGQGQLDNATGAAQAFLSSLNGLASSFGGGIASGLDLGSIGFTKGKFEVRSRAVDRKGNGGGSIRRFDTAEDAIEAALQQALSRGAITGIDASVQKLLSTGDLATQTAKASLLANALKELNTQGDPLKAAVQQLNDQFANLRDVMIEAGSSTEDLAKASALYDKRLQEIQRSSEQAVSGLRNFLNDLNFGSSSPLSLGDQRAAARANYQAQVGQIGNAGFDQGAFVSAGQRLLDIETQLNGRTQDFFSIFNQVQADTNRAISTITNASGITGDNPFARATADATAATANNTSSIAEKLENLTRAVLGNFIGINSFIGTAGTGTGGGNRGFVEGARVREN